METTTNCCPNGERNVCCYPETFPPASAEQTAEVDAWLAGPVAGPFVRPHVGDLVHITFDPTHRVGGKVVSVDADSFDVEKYTEWGDSHPDDEIDFAVGDPAALFTLYDVEQSNPGLIVRVLA